MENGGRVTSLQFMAGVYGHRFVSSDAKPFHKLVLFTLLEFSVYLDELVLDEVTSLVVSSHY